MMLKPTLHSLLALPQVRSALEQVPLIHDLGRQLGAGQSAGEAVATAAELVAAGCRVAITPRLAKAQTERSTARALKAAAELIELTAGAGLAELVDIQLDPAAFGLAIPGQGNPLALRHLSELAEAATRAGVRITVGSDDYELANDVLAIAEQLHRDFPVVGVLLPARLYRSEEDARRLRAGSQRITLSVGDSFDDETLCYQRQADAELSFVRCLKLLLSGSAELVVATDRPTLIHIAEALALRAGGRPYELQLHAGWQPGLESRLAAATTAPWLAIAYGPDFISEVARAVIERPRLLTDYAVSKLAKD